jgi:ribosomal protein S18 acetylase RimI-like enzyme
MTMPDEALRTLPALHLVPARPEDAEALVALRIEAMRESLEQAGRFDPARARDRFLSTFSPDHTRHVELAGERVGFVVTRLDGDALRLDHLYLRPAHQSRGLGSAVLRLVFGEADAAQLPVRVGALRGSRSNVFYLRHGFRLVGQSEFDNHYLRPLPTPDGGFSFRAGMLADASCIGVLATQVFLDTYAPDGVRPELAREALSVYSTAAVEARLVMPERRFVLAERQGHLVGFLEFDHTARCPVAGVTGSEVVRLYVQRRFQRRGLGQALSRRAQALAAEAGQPTVWLTAWAGNTPALAFYRALGWRDVGAAEHVIEGVGYENRVLVINADATPQVQGDGAGGPFPGQNPPPSGTP